MTINEGDVLGQRLCQSTQCGRQYILQVLNGGIDLCLWRGSKLLNQQLNWPDPAFVAGHGAGEYLLFPDTVHLLNFNLNS